MSTIDYLELSDLDCLKVQKRDSSMNMMFQGDDVVINLNFSNETDELSGDIEEL